MVALLAQLKEEFEKLRDPVKAQFLARYFKTGKGEYGEGDTFLGIVVPTQRRLAKKYKDLALLELQRLLASNIHEYRLTALLILVEQYQRASGKMREKIIKFYLKNVRHVNNWDLVDSSAPYLLGDYLVDKDKKLLYELAQSDNMWERRIAIISTYAFIKRNQFADTLTLAKMLLKDSRDLLQKAAGWMLREVGNRNLSQETDFLDTYAPTMPRTMLRYAIEKLPPEQRRKYLDAKSSRSKLSLPRK